MLKKFEQVIIGCLIAMMALVIVISTVELAVVIFRDILARAAVLVGHRSAF